MPEASKDLCSIGTSRDSGYSDSTFLLLKTDISHKTAITMPHILVRDFTEKQKSAVEKAAQNCLPKKSTSRFCRDAAVLAAGGKLEDGEGTPVKSASRAPVAVKRDGRRPSKKKGRR